MTADPVYYIRISEKEALPAIDECRPFRAIVVLNDTYSDEWQDMVSRWLVDGGCLYMMAWGPECSSWDDSVDHAKIHKYLPSEAPDEDFVMTTWHDEETLESVFWFSQFCAFDSYDRIRNTLIVHVSSTDRESEFLQLFSQSATLVEREDTDDPSS